jgi:hypothetical protein
VSAEEVNYEIKVWRIECSYGLFDHLDTGSPYGKRYRHTQNTARRIEKIGRTIFNFSPPPVALQSLKDLGRLTYRRFLELFRHIVGLLGRVISPSQGLYLHRTTQHRKTRTNIHVLSGIRTHDPSNQPAKTARPLWPALWILVTHM